MLILICVVALIIGGIYQFNDAIKVWANNYFGDYLSCLLETGELPSIGGAPGDSGICNDFFKPFSLSDGRPFKDQKGNKPVANSGGDGDPDGKARAERESSDTRSKRVGGGGGGSRGGRGGGGPTSSANVNQQSGEQNAAKKVGSAYTGSTDTLNVGGAGGRTYFRSSGGGSGLTRGYYISTDDEADKPTSFAAGSVGAEGLNKASKRFPLKEKRKPAEVPPDEPFTIGNFLRILIIAAIIIALVVLLGGQLLQISKNMD